MRSGSAAPSPPAGRAAHRHLLLHVHGDQLRGRHLSPPAGAGQAARLRRVHLVLPAPSADRSFAEPSCCPRFAAGATPNRWTTRVPSGSSSPDCSRRSSSRPTSRARSSPPSSPRPPNTRAGSDLCRLGLRGTDLLRLQRLHRTSPSARHAARLPVPAELRCAPTRRATCRTSGGAGTMTLSAGCATTSTSRWAEVPTARPRPSATSDHHGVGRALARRRLDLRDLGGPAGSRAELRPPTPEQPGAAGLPGVAEGRYGPGSSAS